MPGNLTGPLDLTMEVWREYDFEGRIYRISNPQKIWLGRTTHRVLDDKGIIHCVPTVGERGCVLRWISKLDNDHAVSW